MQTCLETDSPKQAAWCLYHELKVEIEPDPDQRGRYVFSIFPAKTAQELISRLDAGETANAKRLLAHHDRIHKLMKTGRQGGRQ